MTLFLESSFTLNLRSVMFCGNRLLLGKFDPLSVPIEFFKFAVSLSVYFYAYHSNYTS